MNFIRILTTALVIAGVALGGTVQAQVTDKKSLALDGARKVIAAAEEYAKQNKAPGGVIAVVDAGGNLMALERLDGTFAAGASISIGKARTAVLFQKPTKVFEDAANTFGGDSEKVTNLPVTYFSKGQTDAAFEKGAVLFDGQNSGRNYQVNASRRDGPGLVEIHTKDTDVFYVLKGSATVVTGGTMIDGKPMAADEIRGKEITGGETRELTPGDTMIIPSGVPHWFKSVQAPFLYFTVKVR